MMASCPFETLGVDVTGTHPKSAKGNIYILTVIDHFSKFAFAFPMRNQEDSTVAKILVEKVICLMETPTRILTDQGPNFESNLFKELCKALGMAKVRTSPYEASTNGLVDRFHLTLNSMLAKTVKESQKDWDDRLPYVMAAYRATQHTSTTLTPNFVVFGHENVMPADLVLCNSNVLPPSENSPVEFVAEQQKRFRFAYETVRNHLKLNAKKRKAYYDASVRARSFEVGSRVWYFYPRQYVRRSKKWSFAYVGPYTVLRKISDLSYEIQKSRKDKPIIVHIDKLKLCVEPESDRSPDFSHKNCVCLLQEAAMESSGSEERLFACTECPRKFKRKFDLSRHEQDKHLREPAAEDKRAFACLHCSSSFKRLFDLERHDLAKHLRGRVICPICEASLSSEGILRRHLKTVHPATSKPSGAMEEARGATALPSPDKGVTAEVKASESGSVYRVREQLPEETVVLPIEAEASSMFHSSSPRPRVTYERDEGYSTLARVDPALAFGNRPIRYLDLRPTTPEADEVKSVLERWRMQILDSPFSSGRSRSYGPVPDRRERVRVRRRFGSRTNDRYASGGGI